MITGVYHPDWNFSTVLCHEDKKVFIRYISAHKLCIHSIPQSTQNPRTRCYIMSMYVCVLKFENTLLCVCACVCVWLDTKYSNKNIWPVVWSSCFSSSATHFPGDHKNTHEDYLTSLILNYFMITTCK